MKEAAELSTPTSDYQVICTKLFLSSGIHPKVKIIWEWFIFYLGSGCSSGRELIWVAFYSSRTRRHRFPSLLIFHHWCVPIVEPCFIQWILVNFTVFNTGWCLPWSDSCPCWLPNEATGYYSAHSKWQVFMNISVGFINTLFDLQVWSWEKDLSLNLWPPPRNLAG